RYLPVIPGRRVAASPESIIQIRGYGFRTRELRSRSGMTSAQRHVHRALRQLDTEAALVELRHDRSLKLVALVEERQAERETDVAAEDLGVLAPGDHGARAHDGRDVAVHERVARQVRDPHHLVDDVAALSGAIVLRLGEHDL